MRPTLEHLDNRTLPSVTTLVFSGEIGSEPFVRINPTGAENSLDFMAYNPAFRGGVSVVLADFNQDGIEDIATAPGQGGGPHIQVFDGLTGIRFTTKIGNFMAFDPAFRGGATLAAGDVNGDFIPDLIIGAGAGGGPHLKVFDGATGALILNKMVFQSGFRGGLSLAVGQVDQDALGEIVVGAGPGGGSHIRILNGTTGAIIREFFAFDPAFQGGVSLAVGDSINDQPSFLAVGAGAGGGPHVLGYRLDTGEKLFSLMAGNPNNRDGVRLSVLENNLSSDLMVQNGSTLSFYSGQDGSMILPTQTVPIGNSATPFPGVSRWDWMEGTKWYVPIGNLLGYFFAESGVRIPVKNQTLWDITKAENGIFEGTGSATYTGADPNYFSFSGFVTPSGRIQMKFTLTSNSIIVTGMGQMRWRNGEWAAEMQMATLAGVGYTMHWAYMLQYQDGVNPPSPDGTDDVMEFRSEEFRWLEGTKWDITYQNVANGSLSQDTFFINEFHSGYFWGDTLGPNSYTIFASVTPEGRVLFTNFRNPGGLESLIGTIPQTTDPASMVLRSYDGKSVLAKAKLVA